MIYGIIFVSILVLIYFVLSMRQTVIVYEEPVLWWPWSITSYNWWPYWSYGSSGGYDGRNVHHKGPHHAPHQESRPWGGASRHANASAPSRGHAGSHGGGHR